MSTLGVSVEEMIEGILAEKSEDLEVYIKRCVEEFVRDMPQPMPAEVEIMATPPFEREDHGLSRLSRCTR